LSKEPLLVRGEQVIAPGNGVAQRLVPRRGIARAIGEDLEATLETREQRHRWEDSDAGSGQLNSQWQAFQPPADFGHDGRVSRRKGEVGDNRLRAGHKEAAAIDLGDSLHGHRASGHRNGEGRHGKELFAREPEPRTAGHQDLEAGAGGEERSYAWSRLNHLLEIVEGQEQVFVLQERRKLVLMAGRSPRARRAHWR
jgi:hypothetical protein